MAGKSTSKRERSSPSPERPPKKRDAELYEISEAGSSCAANVLASFEEGGSSDSAPSGSSTIAPGHDPLASTGSSSPRSESSTAESSPPGGTAAAESIELGASAGLSPELVAQSIATRAPAASSHDSTIAHASESATTHAQDTAPAHQQGSVPAHAQGLNDEEVVDESWIDAHELIALLESGIMLDDDVGFALMGKVKSAKSELMQQEDMRAIDDSAVRERAVFEALNGRRVPLESSEEQDWVRKRRGTLLRVAAVRTKFSYRPSALASDTASPDVLALRAACLDNVAPDLIDTIKDLILGLPGTSAHVREVVELNRNSPSLVKFIIAEGVTSLLACAPDVQLPIDRDWKLLIWKHACSLKDCNDQILSFDYFSHPDAAIAWGANVANIPYTLEVHRRVLGRDSTTFATLHDDAAVLQRHVSRLSAWAYLRCVFKMSSGNAALDASHVLDSYTQLRRIYRFQSDLLVPKVLSIDNRTTHESELDWLVRVRLPLRVHSIEAPVSFANPFCNAGDALNALANYVRFVHEVHNETCTLDAGYIYPVFPLIQSSGWGKTRLAFELRNKVPALYICLRNEQSSGLPARSPRIADDILRTQDEASYQRLFLRMLVAYYAVIKSCSDSDSPQAAADLMHLTFSTTAPVKKGSGIVAFTVGLGAVINSAESFWDFVLHRIDEQMLAAIFDNNADLVDRVQTVLDPTSNVPDLATVVGHLKSRIEASWKKNGTVTFEVFPMAIVIDEASGLLRSANSVATAADQGEDEGQRYLIFRKAMAAFGSCFVGCLIDTNGKISNYAPPASLDSSLRAISGGYLFHPFYLITFPELRDLPHKLRSFFLVAQPSDGKIVRFNPFEMMMHSRPLFLGMAAHYTGGDPIATLSVPQIWQQLVTLSANKILQCRLMDAHSVSSPFRIIAVFAARFTIIPNDQVAGQDMVASAMATLQCVNSERSIAHVSYVPEPMVALGAVEIMRRRNIFSLYLKRLTRLIAAGKVGAVANPGNYGELVASIILARAFDVSVPVDQQTDGHPPAVSAQNPNYGQHPNLTGDLTFAEGTTEPALEYHPGSSVAWPTTLRAMLTAMFNSASLQGAFDAMAQPLSSLLNDGWLWPIQFVHCPRDLTKSASILKDAWSRRFALVTCHDQEGCDIVVPIKVAHSDGALRLTGLFVEVKCHTSKITSSKLWGFVQSVHNTARRLVPDGPIACMVLQLGVGGIRRPQFKERAPAAADRVWVNRVMRPADSGLVSPGAAGQGLEKPNEVYEDEACSDRDVPSSSTNADSGAGVQPPTAPATLKTRRRKYEMVSSSFIDPDMLLITAHTIDNVTFGPCLTEDDCVNMREMIDKPGQLAYEINEVMRTAGYDEASAKGFLASRHGIAAPRALQSGVNFNPIADPKISKDCAAQTIRRLR